MCLCQNMCRAIKGSFCNVENATHLQHDAQPSEKIGKISATFNLSSILLIFIKVAFYAKSILPMFWNPEHKEISNIGYNMRPLKMISWLILGPYIT